MNQIDLTTCNTSLLVRLCAGVRLLVLGVGALAAGVVVGEEGVVLVVPPVAPLASNQ